MLSYFVFSVQLDEMTFRICLKINNNASFTASSTLDFATIYVSFERQVNQRVYNNLKQMPQSEMLLLLLLLLTAITKLHDNKSHISSRMKSFRVNRISQHLPSTGSVSYWQGKQPFWESESKEIHMKITLEKWWLRNAGLHEDIIE